MVKIKFLDKYKKTYRYLIENTEHTSLNSIRRIISYLLPIYAIDEVDFFENDSCVIDEMLANRIGLCPIKTPSITTGKKVTFKIDKKGPCTVYSEDMISSDKDIEMVYNTIPLTKLNENENIVLEAFAGLGIGKEHVKYSPAIVSYANLFELDVPRACESCKKLFEKCSKNAIKSETSKKIILNPSDYDLCHAQAEKCDKKCFKLSNINNYILTIELIGQCSIKDLLKLSSRYIKEYTGVLKKKIK